MINKAVILAGGKGTRIANPDMPKAMIKLNGTPILENTLQLLGGCGINEVFMLVHYLKEQIIGYFGSDFNGMKINYVNVHEILKYDQPIGIADVLGVMDGRINEPFLMILGDEVYAGTKHPDMLKSFNPVYDAMIGVMRTTDERAIKKNYTLRVDDAFNVTDLEEKPDAPWNDLLGCGTYIFTPKVFDYIRQTPLSAKSGRREITDTLKVIAANGLLAAFDLGGSYVNINYKEDIALAEKLFK
ncbi:MAG: nucleotidyltransferase family protein [Candidatus Nanoarchaeia archaeon]|jgi:glucose-1-phosphate thymidylyltransferase